MGVEEGGGGRGVRGGKGGRRLGKYERVRGVGRLKGEEGSRG